MAAQKTDDLLEDCSQKREREILPHGSGINSDWNIKYHDLFDSFVCENVFEHMDEFGSYDENVPFAVKIPVKTPEDSSVWFTGTAENQTFAENVGLGEYLDDTLAFAIKNHLDAFADFCKQMKRASDQVANLSDGDVVFNVMQALSENRKRSEKDAMKLRKALENIYKEYSDDKEFIAYALEHKLEICRDISIAPPVHDFSDLMHASFNKNEVEARVVLNEGSDQFYERSIRLRKDSYGYSVMSYGASTDYLSALTKMKFFFENRLIGEMELTDKDTFEKRDTFKVYGRGTMQGLLDKYFVDMIDKRELVDPLRFAERGQITKVEVLPPSDERFPEDMKKACEDFVKSGGKEIHYGPLKSITR